MFATRQGTIAAWAPNLPVNPTVAVTAVDNSAAQAVYTGLEFGVTDKGVFIYAANVNSGLVDVFDTNFQPAGDKLTGNFTDPRVPTGFVPFGIHAVDGNIVVTYAKQNSAKNFITTGIGLGFVAIYDTNGNLIEHLLGRGQLNAPWGVARAPIGFGGAGNRILVGNFGDGHILAINPLSKVTNKLTTHVGTPIALPGLWELKFGGGSDSDADTLFFTQSVSAGQHGLFGFVRTGPSGDHAERSKRRRVIEKPAAARSRPALRSPEIRSPEIRPPGDRENRAWRRTCSIDEHARSGARYRGSIRRSGLFGARNPGRRAGGRISRRS